MSTTIQIEENTLQIMKTLKADFKVKTYNEVIEKLVELRGKLPRSRFGAHPEMTEFTEDDEAEFHDL